MLFDSNSLKKRCLNKKDMRKNDWRSFNIKTAKSKAMCNNFCQFDAVFIPTKDQKLRVSEQLTHLAEFDISKNIFIVPSEMDDAPDKLPLFCSNLLVPFLCFKDNYSFSGTAWDLPCKRNFAINYSIARKYNKILLLDDDIRFIKKEMVYSLINSLDNFWISSCFSTMRIDTSLIGEIAINCGKKHINFLSGNCLAVNLCFFIPYFPNIYNEDWLAIIPAILAKTAVLAGPVIQLDKNIENWTKTASFQEFGELITDEIYDHLSRDFKIPSLEGLFKIILDKALWEKAIADRYTWLNYLLATDHCEKTQAIISGALSSLANITAKNCIDFLNRWKNKILL